jgi:ABC-type uncharacterized transport system involved in gliding motility auxiliary subunit
MSNLISLLLHSRTQAHIYHFLTKSYAQHKALENYYTQIVPLLDTYAEAYQGKYGIIKKYKTYSFSENPKTKINYFKNLLIEIQNTNIPDQYLQNIVESIYELVYKTLYMLVYLS